MSSYSWMKRMLAVVLAFSMTLGVVPANAVDVLTAEAEPETTPQISPITSLQIELTFSALRKSFIAS